MDDIFKILIWVVLIIAFRLLFGKKEPPKQPAPRQRPDMEKENFPVKQQSAQTVDKEEYDILKEIESLFKTDTSKPTRLEQKQNRGYETTPTDSEHVSYEQTRNPEEYTSYERQRTPLETRKMDTTRIKTEGTLTASEHSIEAFTRKQEQSQRKGRQVDPEIAKQAGEFEQFLKSRDNEINMAVRIRSRFNQPESLKEFIIMSEVLNRPSRMRSVPANRKTFRR